MPNEIRGATIASTVSLLDKIRDLYNRREPVPFPIAMEALDIRQQLAAALPAVKVTEGEYGV